MRKLSGVLVYVVVLMVLSSPLYASDKATPKEVVKKVSEAVGVLSKTGEAGLAEFNDPNSKWLWGGTYVFITKCEPYPSNAAHPIKPSLVGKNLSKLKDKTGNYFFIQLCEASSDPKGGWVEYLWPKPGEKKHSRKVTFCQAVPGNPYGVCVGIYDDSLSIEELNNLVY